METENRRQLIYEIFCPSSPIENESLFIGRQTELQKIKDAIEQRGQHIVMFGGRGVGKTSIANIVCSVFENVISSKITCNRTDNFASIWEKVLNKIRFISENKTIGFNSSNETEFIKLELPNKEFIDATDIENIFLKIPEYILIIFDEFDIIENMNSKFMMADTLKILSDNVPNVTVMIVGIAESVNELIGEHPSLERCIKQIEVPLMTDEEAIEMIMNSMKILEMTIENEIAERIVEYSSGFPHYIHLLCKYAALNALDNESSEIKSENFDWAVLQSIENSDHSLRSAYKMAVSSSKQKNQFEDVILASSLADTDEFNSFTAEDVLVKFNELTQREAKPESINYNLGMLCKTERGIILEKVDKLSDTRYKFKNPLMKAFIKLKFHLKEE